MLDEPKLFSEVMSVNKKIWTKLLPCAVLLILEMVFDVSECISQAEVNNHLELGRQFLAKRQLSDALTHYHAAVDGDPTNYLTYFKRSTVYLALGIAKNALSDLDRALELKPDFTAARISRGNVQLKLGHYDTAQLDFYNVLQMDPYNTEANELIQKIGPTTERKRLAEYYYAHDDYENAIQLLTEVLEVSPWFDELYDLRSEMHMQNNDHLAAVNDIKAATKLRSDDTQGYYKMSTLLYQLGNSGDALKAIRECLKLDPEHKDCFPFYKRIRKIDKFLTEANEFLEQNNFVECVNSASKVIKNERQVQMIIYEAHKLLCTCNVKYEETSDAIEACSDAIHIKTEPGVYCDRADAYILSELFDDAIRDFKSALEIDPNFERAKEGLKRAQKLQQQSEKRDYYKILEVKRTASKKEITKAYRKMAQKWHPDNYQNDEKMKKIAEKKFIDIAAAKEVLTDDEKRKQFDNGEDPLDPESGQHGMPNFQQFHTFHGSPFQFRFHFN